MKKHPISFSAKEVMTRLRKAMPALLRKCWLWFGVLIVASAIIFTVFRALTPWVKRYKIQVEQHLSIMLGQPVAISDIETSWYWFEPVLKIDQVILSDKNDHVLKLNNLLIGINLLSSLWHWQIQPGMLYVDDVHLVIRQIDDHWEIEGLQANKQATTTLDKNSYLPVLAWILTQDKTIVKHVSAEVYLSDGSIIPLHDLNLKVVHAYGHYRLFGNVQLAQEIPTSLSIIADLNIDSSALQKTDGQFYISAKDFLPTQWQSLWPKMAYHVERGVCNLQVWADVNDAAISNVQSVVDVHDLVWTEEGKAKSRQIDSLQGNLAWKHKKNGWRFTADQLNLKVANIQWPENALSLDYKQAEQTYRVFIKTLLLKPLFALPIEWPEKMQQFLKMQPEGELSNTQIGLNSQQIDYILTRFNHLGWRAKPNIPGVRDISGVFYWQPTEGRLELDGEKTVIKPYHLQPLTFDLFNAAFDWKELSNGFRVSMDRFVLSQPNLVLSASGALDNALTSTGNLRLTTEFAAKNARNLLQYLPYSYLKPKLDAWLKQDITRIEHATGRININGALADFPFDNKPGEFSIVSHVSGVDLLINSDWPLNQDIDADITVDKRTFVANVDRANLNGVLIDRVNLVINDMGSGQEALLIHGQVSALGEQVKSYIFATPLRDRLSRWKAIDIGDQLQLDLRLDIPLYPESDHVVAIGNLAFNNNQVAIEFPLTRIVIDNVTGGLQFNEYGLTTGGLQGTLVGTPVALHAQSIDAPKPGTVLSIEGETTIDYLKQKLPTPLLGFMEGHFNLTGLWTIYHNEAEPDQLHLDSSLNGLAIELPKPLGKLSTDTTPFSADIIFNTNKSTRVNFNYDNRLTSNLLFTHQNEKTILNKGELHFGPGKLPQPTQSGLSISGAITKVDMQEWRDIFAKLPKEQTQSDVLKHMNLNLGNVIFFGQNYNNVQVKMNKLSKDDWSLKLNQQNFSADLHYQPEANLLSGHLDYLYLSKVGQESEKLNAVKSGVHPNDIPNLNLTIDTLKLDQVEVGSVNLKSTSSKTRWLLDYCTIKSPEYRLSVQGDWTQQDKQAHSTIEAGLEIDDLGKSLERWHLNPVVHAHQGNISLQGEWNAPFYEFSLSKITGKMQITLKNGRISHFDKETEEKLGLGKLLSILSLQTIPRRLKLDFSDLSEEGYSFDIFKGNFDINHGVMSTHDSYIDGPVAYARMEGDLDLSKRLYDVNLRIVPYITASLPVVATIAGGPIAGIATWVASNLINKGMQKISGYTYKISGPWLDPVVQQVSIDRSPH